MSKKFLASLCEDGNVYVWSRSESENNEEHDNDSSHFNFLYSIQSSSEIGQISDCKIIDTTIDNATLSDSNSNNLNNMNTLAICTTFGYIKIYNMESKAELFSLRLNLPETEPKFNKNNFTKLNKLFYSLDHIITIDSTGYIYFVSLQQFSSSNNSTSLQKNKETSTFLSHSIKLSANCLQTLCIYKDSVICVGDSDGYIYLLSIFDI